METFSEQLRSPSRVIHEFPRLAQAYGLPQSLELVFFSRNGPFTPTYFKQTRGSRDIRNVGAKIF